MQKYNVLGSCCIRSMCSLLSRNKGSFALSYAEYGDPAKVLKKVEENINSVLGPKDVRVRILAATVNPADINTVQGTYGVKAVLPAIGGNEGVAEVVEIGSEVENLKPGSWVIPCMQGSFSTWRTQYLGPENEFLEIPNNISLESAVTMMVNPCTAYRMLKDFLPLKAKDTIIQNGANSGVGQAAIQIAKLLGLNSINIIRKRDNLEEMKSYLTSLGASYVITEEDLRAPVMEDIFKSIPKPKLAFNCVGGKSTTDMLRHLSAKGIMVTYGGMSRQPVTVPTAALIFKDLTVKGFWLTAWVKNNTFTPERHEMLNYLFNKAKAGELKPPKCALVPFDNYIEAIQNIMVPFISKKYVLVMDPKYLK